MISEDFANILGRCIQKYAHALNALGHLKRNGSEFESEIIYSIAIYVNHLCDGIFFNQDDASRSENNQMILLSRMKLAYDAIVECYTEAVVAEIDSVNRKIEEYEEALKAVPEGVAIELKNVNIDVIREKIESFSAVVSAFPLFKDMSKETLAQDWNEHFGVFEKEFESLSLDKGKMSFNVSTIQARLLTVDLLKNSDTGIKLANTGKKLAIYSAGTGTLGLLGGFLFRPELIVYWDIFCKWSGYC